MRARFTAFFAIAISLVACGGSDSSSDLNGPSSTGGASGASCTALLVCCAQIADADMRKSCLDTESKNASASTGDAVCAQLTVAYQSSGLCGGSGAGGASGVGGGTSVGGAPAVGGSGNGASSGSNGKGGSGTAGTSGVGGSGTAGTSGVGGSGTAGTSGVGGSGTAGAAGSGAAGSSSGNPITCADAAASPSTVGCEFWPTVTANLVWSIFDYAVVVANPGSAPASVTVTRGGASVASASVQPGAVQTIYLPWVPQLKGPDTDAMGSATPLTASVGVLAGAYRLVADRPVSVTQFNPIEATGKGGPAGKNWSSCPGNAGGLGCFSFSADASILLPSSALGTSYRVAGKSGWTFQGQSTGIGPTLSITAIANGTTVKVALGAAGKILGGPSIDATAGGGVLTLSLAAGDAVELVGDMTSDFSGTLVTSNLPVQIISGIPCTNVPDTIAACDHIEESLMPTTALGKKHVVAVPTAPGGKPIGHVVRIVGHVDGTKLSYSKSVPGAPLQINAGQVVDLGQVTTDFVVDSSSPIVVVSLLLGGTVQDPNGPQMMQKGDPSLTVIPPVEQLRASYLFLAPTDYDEAWADVTLPAGATATVDGAPVTATPIDASWSVARVKLVGQGGAHQLTATAPAGLQVLGFAAYTSVEYPGGYGLAAIAP